MMYRISTAICLSMALFVSCKERKADTLFNLLTSGQTGIDFNNEILESDSFNILTYEYIYNGGGVGIGDFNNDSRPDIFFTGNQVQNRLYLNQGNFKFKDITETANINLPGRWSTGVSVVDINNDGFLDVYVSSTTNPDPEKRRNMLFVNQGLNANNEPTFKELAAEYGINYSGHSITSAFLDYDNDSDLDLYILDNVKIDDAPTNFRETISDGSSPNNDRLFRNEGNGTFKEVTMEAGIVHEGFGLGLSVHDFNDDGWTDIYVSNDYLSNDILYINNQNGTFRDATSEFISHQSQFSMGNDAGDVNNDGLTDLITVDMLPENSERKKTTIGNKSYLTYINNEQYHYQYQFTRNMLQLNNGSKAGLKFSEVGMLSGVHQTEWSWSPLFVDFDNDGKLDLVITNGFPKDITDKDFANYRSSVINLVEPAFMIDSIPIVKIPNYAFRNKGDLTFEDASASWGLNAPSFSNGAAFADLDGDGDMDYVVNNINSEAFVYKNNLYSIDKKENAPHYIQLKLKGPSGNTSAQGAKIKLYYDNGKLQYHDHSIYRGYMSTVDNVVHFGLGQSNRIDSIAVVWPDGKQQLLTSPKVDQVLSVDHKDALFKAATSKKYSTLFSDASQSSGLDFVHTQNDIIDFNIQRTIPHKFSQFGPALATGDINGDGLEDLFIGGSPGADGTFFIQGSDGRFKPAAGRIKKQTTEKQSCEDVGALLFDADGDRDLDLYLVRGGFEFEKDNAKYQDELYFNDGKGVFSLANDALPQLTSSGACVRAGDFDADGDLDLFVGGRVVPAQYPYAPESFILKNEGGKFSDVTDAINPQLKNIGMVTDALWSDFDNDGKTDLVVAGELMALKFLKNQGSTFEILKTDADSLTGWWNSLTGADFDRDGDIDYIAGNLGQNNFYHASPETPVTVFAKDLDKNGSVDAITACFSKMQDGSVQLCPIHFWDELNQQSPRFRRQFNSYKKFSKATFDMLIPESDREGALILKGNYPSSSYVENLGSGKFRISPLPVESQVAPVNGMTTSDVNGDGNIDVVMVGNDFGNEVFIGRHDSFIGLVLAGDGKGGFTPLSPIQSGFYVPRDAKSLVKLSGKNGNLFVASQNRDRLKAFSISSSEKGHVFIPERNDAYVVITHGDGKKEKIEVYFGSGYLSQSTRNIAVPKGAKDIVVFDVTGKSRKLEPSI